MKSNSNIRLEVSEKQALRACDWIKEISSLLSFKPVVYCLLTTLITLGSFSSSLSQEEEDTLKVKKAPLEGFTISGNYRFFAQHRYFTNPYVSDVVDGDPITLQKRSVLVGDASQLPELTLNISGRPTPKTSFGTDLVVWNQNNGNFDYYRNLQLGINLYGNFTTEYANVGVRAGGIHWHSMTPFTMRSFSGYNRFSLFDRAPWDPQFNQLDKRYSDYYKNGAISQDQRWAQQAVQGMILDVTELPLGFAVNLMYGKTQNAGSAFVDLGTNPNDSTNNQFIKFFNNTIPNNAFGGRLIKTFKSGTVSLNSFNRLTYADEEATQEIRNSVNTVEFEYTKPKWSVYGELGLAQYEDPFQDLERGELVSLKLRLNEKLTKLPIEFHYYRISPNAINNNAEFVNTSVIEAQSAAATGDLVIGANGVLQQSGSAMLALGQMANNREALSINTELETKNLVISLGNSVGKELVNQNNVITYGHIVNGLTMSRFWRWFFPSNVGPYDRTSVLFRGVYENVNLTDLADDGSVVNDKFFNNLESQIKGKYRAFGHESHVFYLGAYNSVQTEFSPITVFTEEAYIRQYAHQVENYLKLHPKFILTQYFGLERVIGNYSTQVDIDSRRPRNQENLAIGGGFDLSLSKNTALYVRHRYFKFEDRNYEFDQYAGHETTLELKIIF